jgi:hypothetical protein
MSELLIRAWDAAESALESVTSDAVESPDIVAEPALRMREWQITVALRDITGLRAEHESKASASSGPMTDSVFGPSTLAQDTIASRVTALERYAAEVLAARSTFREWQDALRISDLNGRYLDLVARTAADEHAVSEISGLTDQAAAAARAVRESMRQVGLAATALALSEPAREQARTYLTQTRSPQLRSPLRTAHTRAGANRVPPASFRTDHARRQSRA